MRPLACAVACLALAGCRPAGRSVRIDPALATLVPPDAVLLAGLRIDKLRETPAWQRHAAGRPLPFLDAAARETGLDLRRDLWELLLVANREHTVAFARGRFAEQGMEPRVFGKARRTPYGGYTLLGTDDAALVFLTSSTIAAGPPAAVKWAIDQRGRATGPPAALAEMVRAIPPENQVWVVASGAPALPSQNLANIVSMAQSVRAALHLDTGAHLTAEVTANEADQVHGALTLLTTLSGIKAAIERQDRIVRLDATLTPEQLSKLLEGGL
jgi:hypothetical protein